jgi:hypothetical protein
VGAYSEASLHGRWVRSNEDDTEHEVVFRPASYAFPPSRGRTSIEFRPDGTYVESSPGPVDVPEGSTGRWSLEGNRLVLEAGGGRPGHAWEIADAGGDSLALKK